MPIFIIETTAESPIREFWRVEAATADQARDKFEAGEVGDFLFDEVLGDETEREVAQVHPRADLAGTISLHNAQQEAPAMLAALRKFTSDNRADNDGNTVAFLVPVADYEAARAILARIDGTPTAQPAGAIGEAGPDDAAVIAAANLSRAGLVNAAREAEALEIPIGEAGAPSMEGDA